MKTKLIRLMVALSVLALPALVQAQFTFTTNSGAITITGYNPAAGLNVVIPASTNGYPVTSIGDNAFQFSGLTSVTIPNSVTNIGYEAFYFCIGLTSVTIGNSVTSIGDYVFVECSGLTNIAVDAANPNYSSTNGVLFDKDQATLIQYPIGLTNSSYTIPNSVTSIGAYAFAFCSGLTSVSIPSSVTSIGFAAFGGCPRLTSVTIPDSITSIGDLAFSLTSLTSVTIPDSVTNIGAEAFQFCSSLTSITFSGNAPLVDGVEEGSTDFTVFQSDPGTVYYYAGTSGWGSTYGGLSTVELFAPQIGGGGIQSGNFGFTITGVSNQTVTVEASTNLLNWQVIQTITLSGTSTNFTDPQWTNFPDRFYRAASAYTVGGTLTGLPAGDTVTLQDNGSDNLTLSTNGTFTFPTALPDGHAYSVTVSGTSGGTETTRTLMNGSGIISGANVTNVAVLCPPLYTGNLGLDMYNAAVADGTAHGGVPGIMATEDGGPIRVTAVGPYSYDVCLHYSGYQGGCRLTIIVGTTSCSSTILPIGPAIEFGTGLACGGGPYGY
jgi:BspA type Leucine rich repeat region (6 copies)